MKKQVYGNFLYVYFGHLGQTSYEVAKIQRYTALIIAGISYKETIHYQLHCKCHKPLSAYPLYGYSYILSHQFAKHAIIAFLTCARTTEQLIWLVSTEETAFAYIFHFQSSHVQITKGRVHIYVYL